MARSYSNQSFGTKQHLTIPVNVALNGTRSSATTILAYTFMSPVKVLDANVLCDVLGTCAGNKVILGYSLAGTGSVTGVGTISLIGTNAAGTVVDGSVTETAFTTGDDLVVQLIGTDTSANLRIQIGLQVREDFVESDT